MPYARGFKKTLKNILGSFPMKGFDRKVAIQLPNLSSGKTSVVRNISESLVEELQAKVTWLGEDDIPITATVSFQRYVLGQNGWRAEFVNESNQEKLGVPLNKFVDCCVENKAANILPEFKSNTRDGFLDLYDRLGK